MTVPVLLDDADVLVVDGLLDELEDDVVVEVDVDSNDGVLLDVVAELDVISVDVDSLGVDVDSIDGELFGVDVESEDDAKVLPSVDVNSD